jgi:hypothetical protein
LALVFEKTPYSCLKVTKLTGIVRIYYRNCIVCRAQGEANLFSRHVNRGFTQGRYGQKWQSKINLPSVSAGFEKNMEFVVFFLSNYEFNSRSPQRDHTLTPGQKSAANPPQNARKFLISTWMIAFATIVAPLEFIGLLCS